MARGLSPESLASRMLAFLATRAATSKGLAIVLKENPNTVSSALSQLEEARRVAVIYTLGEARKRGVNVVSGPKTKPHAKVFGLVVLKPKGGAKAGVISKGRGFRWFLEADWK